MKFFKGKTWIDWVKVIVAIDITAVGIGLIFQQKIHILADLLGPASRILFGILYIMVAAVIFKAVFPELFKELNNMASSRSKKSTEAQLATEAEPKETVGEMIDRAAKKIDTFVQGKAMEVKEEVKKELNETEEEVETDIQEVNEEVNEAQEEVMREFTDTQEQIIEESSINSEEE
jgi:gas vesicle protein